MTIVSYLVPTANSGIVPPWLVNTPARNTGIVPPELRHQTVVAQQAAQAVALLPR